VAGESMTREISILAAELGLVQRGRSWGPCPVCKAEVRGAGERRGPISVYDGDLSWRCHASGCAAGGSAAALLAAHRFGEVPPPGDPRWRDVMQELDGEHSTSATARSTGVRTPQGAQKPRNDGPGPARSPSYPPVDEVRALWATCVRFADVSDTHPAPVWIKTRGLDPRAIDALSLAKVMPDRGPWPPWLPHNAHSVHRVVVPMFDHIGELRSLRFRAVVPRKDKALPPMGFNVTGLVMADPIALALLRHQTEDEDRVSWDGRVVVSEGEPDFWTWAAMPRRMEAAATLRRTYACFGIVSGSWTQDLADRIPDRASVVARTHDDEPGDKYAEVIRLSFGGRCTFRRTRLPAPPPGGHDGQQVP
jgi:hypothetical protein